MFNYQDLQSDPFEVVKWPCWGLSDLEWLKRVTLKNQVPNIFLIHFFSVSSNVNPVTPGFLFHPGGTLFTFVWVQLGSAYSSSSHGLFIRNWHYIAVSEHLTLYQPWGLSGVDITLYMAYIFIYILQLATPKMKTNWFKVRIPKSQNGGTVR